MNIERIINEMKKAVYGKDDVLEKILMCIMAEGHVILEDKPGVGKTTIAKTVSKVLGLEAKRIQFTSDVMPSDVTGYITYNKNKGVDEFVPGPIFGTNILLADEINRASSKCQAALLEVMQERQATISSITKKVEDPFVVIATMNPYISSLYGVSVLPQSELDRFSMALSVGYPEKKDELALLASRDKGDPVESLETVSSRDEILAARKEIDDVYVDMAIYQYVYDLASATRNNSEIEVGISPRGELVLLRMAKANAYFRGRNYVLPDDIKAVFIDVCVHRISMKEQEMTVISDRRIKLLKRILEGVAEPPLLRNR